MFRSDGGPQFTSNQFKEFLTRWGVSHKISSPYYAQSNGHAEASVKAMKNLIMKTTSNGNITTEEFQNGLLEWRNTPRSDGLSPAEIVFGHPMRTRIPIHRSKFINKWMTMDAEYDLKKTQQLKKQDERYNSTAKSLKPISLGKTVRIQHPLDKTWECIATVVEIGKYRNYLLKLPCGKTYWRNRRFLREVS